MSSGNRLLLDGLSAVGVHFIPPLVQMPSGVGIDSRTVQAGELFLAYRGERFDGHDFVAAAVERGAAGVVVRQGFTPPKGVAQAQVADPNILLGIWGAAQRKVWGGRLIGVTGSNGKTTVKGLLKTALAEDSSDTAVLATEGNLNNLIGVPLTLLRLRREHELAVVEMGMNAIGEIAQLSRWATPQVGVIVNVGAAHSGMLGCPDGVRRAKLEIAQGVAPGGVLVLPENLNGEPLRPDLKVLRFGSGAGCDIRVVGRTPTGSGQRIELATPQGDVTVHLPLPGPHQGGNVAAVLTVGLGLGLDLHVMAARLCNVEPIPGRMALVGRNKAVCAWNDTYNANPDSVLAAWDAVVEQAGAGVPVLVLGTLKEVDPADPAWGRLVRALVEGKGRLVVVGDDLLASRFEAMGGRFFSFASQDDAWKKRSEWWPKAGAVVFKGSRSARMENMVGLFGFSPVSYL